MHKCVNMTNIAASVAVGKADFHKQKSQWPDSRFV